VIVIAPKREVLAKDYNGKTFTRLGEVVCDSKGGAYFKDDNDATYFVDAKGKVSPSRRQIIRTTAWR